jgi:translation initiation factor 5B
MAPKKKGNKKAAQDDWEAELGESIAPPANNDADGTASPAAAEEPAADDALASGLMGALQRRNKKKKKNQPQDWEAELGEDAPAAAGEQQGSPAAVDLSSKAPEEGNLDDEEDVFAGNYKKKGKAEEKKDKKEEKVEEKKDEGPRVKTKAEKEREKKEKEKQRKKELVRFFPLYLGIWVLVGVGELTMRTGCEEEGTSSCEDGTGKGRDEGCAVRAYTRC